MARIFITGSADGLGKMAASSLLAQEHQVVLHARNTDRAKEAIKQNPGAQRVVIGDLSDMRETKDLAGDLNKLDVFDAVIHNAGVYRASADEIFAINTLAPYILTCLVQKPQRLIYLSSGMHQQGLAKLGDLKTNTTRINYSDSKLHVLMLSMAVARKWPGVYSNAVDPGWVPTKMGGRSAPDDLQKGHETQSWLAVSNDEAAKVSGEYFFHKKQKPHNPIADDLVLQEKFLELCGEITGVRFPG